MALKPRQEKFCARFLPGVIDAIKALGEGEFEPHDPELNCIGTDAVIGVAVKLKYKLADGLCIEIRSRWRLRPKRKPYIPHTTTVNIDDWERYSYSLHYGHSFREVKFRFDLDSNNGYHLHIPPDTDVHTPVADVEPDTRDMDTLAFVAVVQRFRADGIYPVRKKR